MFLTTWNCSESQQAHRNPEEVQNDNLNPFTNRPPWRTRYVPVTESSGQQTPN